MTAKQQPEQPVQPQYAPQPDPNAQYGPAPQPANTPYQQQSVNQQYFAQPQAAPVQYVVMAESLKGLKGWLMFFTVLFGLQALGMIMVFFGSMLVSASAASIVAMIFSPFIAAAAIATVVLISMGKKLGKWAAIGTIGLSTLYSIIGSIIAFVSPAATRASSYDADYYYSSSSVSAESSVPMLIATILATIVVSALYSLYFINSRRVKETLVN